MKELKEHTNWVNSLAMIDNKYLASASYDNTVRIFNIQDGSHRILKGHTDSVFDLAIYSPDVLVSVSWDKTARFWSIKDGENIQTLKLPHWGYTVAVLDDGSIATGGADCKVTIWTIA